MFVLAKVPRILSMTTLLAVCLLLPACGKSKVSQGSYDQIKNDMSLKDVETVLGPGKKDESGDGSGGAAQFGVHIGGPEKGGRGVDTYVWESGDKKIKVFLVNGKVTNKQKEGF